MSAHAFATTLRRLLWLRVVMMAALLLASLVATYVYHITLPVPEVAAAIGLMCGINLVSWLRLWRKARIRESELLAQLLLDIAILTWLFHATGGYSNPFVWMYLLPLAVAAVALSWRYTWLIAALVIIAYSALTFWFQPLATLSHDHAHAATVTDSFNLHLLGMWSGFVVSAIVIAFFVERMGRNLREYDRLLAESREKVLASERMLALGTLATGAAHELGTPLSTMAVLTKELLDEQQHQPELAASLALLRKQVDRCKEILSSMTAAAGMMRSEASSPMTVEAFIRQLAQRWSDTRPATPLKLDLQLPVPCPVMVADLALSQAITNLINNAADASPSGIELTAHITGNNLQLDIHDHGCFPDEQTLAAMGLPFNTSKQASGGLGLGIFLAKSVLEKFDGSLRFDRQEPQGTITRIHIPLINIIVKAPA
ncbi:two-component system, sensor histidine kinase RegB [Methylobacillus rhizosphaerae]|uniref:histidine kinase n=1 Tax=Methylobacillus rhizosphaerae TaxID=551994 RepID=A0A238Y2E5_9PROT|nr:ATP-binding protein [Methylobacillus rhizosphaerae]SNR64961.1 two-component system, sensor histidine kinase RegB [Methylobacillus rhizosphaerae]